jgi:hypothetical protein
MKTYGEVDLWIHVSLTSSLVGGDLSALRPCHFTPLEKLRGPQSLSGRHGEVKILDPIET